VLKIGNGLVSDPYAVGTDLLIVADYDHLF
jgi:hypothetical protein